jgi:hypothetical protein
MICALTVRTLKPGTFEQFREAFMQLEAAHSALAGSGTRRGLYQWVTLMSLICSWSPRTVRSWM